MPTLPRKRTMSRLTLYALIGLLLAVNTLALAMPVLQWTPLYEPGCGGWITSIGIDPHDTNHLLMGGDMLSIGYSNDRGNSWQTTSGLASWEVAEFTFHPTQRNVVWAGTMSGPYRSTDGGKTWKSCREGMPPLGGWYYSVPIQKILFDPADANHLLAFSGNHRLWNSPKGAQWGSVWESGDSGNHWTQLADLPNSEKGSNIMTAAYGGESNTMLYAAVRDVGVCTSTDNGKTWAVHTDGLPNRNVYWVATHPTDPKIAWVALGNFRDGTAGTFQPGGIFKTTDGGSTWQAMNTGLGMRCTDNENMSARYEVVVVSPENPNVLYTSNRAWIDSGIYHSSNGGESWTKVIDKPQDFAYPSGINITIMAAHPTDPNTVYAAGSEYLISTTDGGKTWLDLTSYHPTGTSAWRGRGYSGLCCNNIAFDPADKNHIVLTAYDHGNFIHTLDGGATWQWGGKEMPSWNGGWDVAFCGNKTVYVTLGQYGFGGVAKSTDNGATWKIIVGAVHGLPNEGTSTPPSSLYTMPGNADTLWLTTGGKLYKSVDGGNSWRRLHEGPGLTWLQPVSGAQGKFYAAGKAGLYRCDDGETLQLVPKSPQEVTAVASDPSVPGRVYVACWRKPNGGIWRYDDATNLWTLLRTDTYISGIAVDPTDSRRLACVTNDHPYHDASFASGVWLSDDGGETWTQQNSGLGCLRGTVIKFNPHDPEQLIFGSMGSGFFVTRWPKK
ncbi:MAG TPA: hypothetical protein VHV83_15950 [Armatimonadota bacterium]|nr:hypothetical protein [Armatimonadota bacterium]